MLTLGQAAKAVGKTKTTLANAINNGRLSAIRNDKGQYQIDPAELFRVYPKNSQEDAETLRDKTHKDTHYLQSEINLLRQQIEHLSAQLNRELETVKDLRLDRDKWREQTEAIRLLVHQKSAHPNQVDSKLDQPIPKSRWWRRLGTKNNVIT